MTHMMSEFSGIDQNEITKLREAGIENTDDVKRLWAEEPKRAALVEKTGISMERFAKIVSTARLGRLKFVEPKFVELLVAAGIDGPKSLFDFTPESLVKRLGEVVAEKNVTSPMPTLVEIQAWFVDAKPPVAAAV